MLLSPSHAVIGSTRLEKTERFLTRFGFEAEPTPRLSAPAAAALYGLESSAAQRVLRAPGADFGWIRLVETPHPARAIGPYDSRPLAIDLYTRDIVRSLEVAREAGAECGELVEYTLGPLELKEAEVAGPDHLVVVFIEVNQRRPSLLDHESDRLHSEVHSIVFAVANTDTVLPFWSDSAQLETLVDAKIEGPFISQLMGMPRANVPVRFTLLCDADASPARLEFLEFFEDPGEEQPTWPLTAGLHAPGFTVDNLDRAIAALNGADFAEVAHIGEERAVTGLAPGGVRFELWQA